MAAAALSVAAVAAPAHAHLATAESPNFGQVDCMTVVDKSEVNQLHIEYTVAFDDVELMEGDIATADAKTHQFFALRGTVFPYGTVHEIYPFDQHGGDALSLPNWITVADVKRAAAAMNVTDATNFTEEQVPVDGVLETYEGLRDHWIRITADDARVPITQEQAAHGVTWDLTDVPPGLYTIAGFVFSPPWNGWAVRPGVVKVVDSGADPSAASLASIKEFVQGVQGRHVRGCIDAPEGSTIEALFRIEERPEEGWITFVEPYERQGDEVDLCFVNPRPELTGSVRVRLDVTDPDGNTISVYSPDTLTSLSGGSSCVQDDVFCCGAGAAESPDANVDAAPDDAANAPPSGPRVAMPTEEPETAAGSGGGGGCAASTGARAPTNAAAILAAGALAVFLALRRRGGAR